MTTRRLLIATGLALVAITGAAMPTAASRHLRGRRGGIHAVGGSAGRDPHRL